MRIATVITNNHRLNRKLFARLQNISNDILLLVIIIIITGIYFTVSPLNYCIAATVPNTDQITFNRADS